jgi:hypothetical protein
VTGIPMAGVAALGGHADDDVTDAGIYAGGCAQVRRSSGWRSSAGPFQRPVRAPHVAAICSSDDQSVAARSRLTQTAQPDTSSLTRRWAKMIFIPNKSVGHPAVPVRHWDVRGTT